jgi:hypothetical protein
MASLGFDQIIPIYVGRFCIKFSGLIIFIFCIHLKMMTSKRRGIQLLSLIFLVKCFKKKVVYSTIPLKKQTLYTGPLEGRV